MFVKLCKAIGIGFITLCIVLNLVFNNWVGVLLDLTVLIALLNSK